MPPLGISMLKGHLVCQGIKTKCFDLNNFFYNKVSFDLQKEWRKSCNLSLEEKVWGMINEDFLCDLNTIVNEIIQYDIVGLSVYKSNNKVVREFIRMIKGRKSEIKVVLGGPEIARKYFDLGEKILDDFDPKVDLLVAGEGERALLSFVKDTCESKKIVLNDEFDDLSGCAVPDYSDLDLKNYPRYNTVSLLASRGCVKKCTFCAERLLYKKFRVYPVDNILEQLKEHTGRGIKQFVFHDSLINGDLSALEKLCDGIISEFDQISWEAQIAIRCDMPEVLFRKIKESGCYHLFVGLESGCDTVLDRMNKGFTVADAVEFFRKLKLYDISFGVSMITGFPDETEKEFNESLDFIVQNKELIPKIEQVNPFVYYDGIDLSKEADYKIQNRSIDRARKFIDRIDKEGFKYTKAFMLNLVEPEWK